MEILFFLIKNLASFCFIGKFRPFIFHVALFIVSSGLVERLFYYFWPTSSSNFWKGILSLHFSSPSHQLLNDIMKFPLIYMVGHLLSQSCTLIFQLYLMYSSKSCLKLLAMLLSHTCLWNFDKF